MFTKLKSLFYYIDLQMGKILVSQIKTVFFLFISLAFLMGLRVRETSQYLAFILYTITFITMLISVYNLSASIKKERRAITFFLNESERILKKSNEMNVKKKKCNCKILKFTSSNDSEK